MSEVFLDVISERIEAMNKRIHLLTELLMFSNEENARLKAELAEARAMVKEVA